MAELVIYFYVPFKDGNVVKEVLVDQIMAEEDIIPIFQRLEIDAYILRSHGVQCHIFKENMYEALLEYAMNGISIVMEIFDYEGEKASNTWNYFLSHIAYLTRLVALHPQAILYRSGTDYVPEHFNHVRICKYPDTLDKVIKWRHDPDRNRIIYTIPTIKDET